MSERTTRSPYTSIAINAFLFAEKKSHEAELADLRLRQAVVRVPPEERAAYVRETERIEERLEHSYGTKVEREERRLERIRRGGPMDGRRRR